MCLIILVNPCKKRRTHGQNTKRLYYVCIYMKSSEKKYIHITCTIGSRNYSLRLAELQNTPEESYRYLELLKQTKNRTNEVTAELHGAVRMSMVRADTCRTTLPQVVAGHPVADYSSC